MSTKTIHVCLQTETFYVTNLSRSEHKIIKITQLYCFLTLIKIRYSCLPFYLKQGILFNEKRTIIATRIREDLVTTSCV
jgi:hypothetical protein